MAGHPSGCPYHATEKRCSALERRLEAQALTIDSLQRALAQQTAIVERSQQTQAQLRNMCTENQSAVAALAKSVRLSKTMSRRASIGDVVSFNLQCIARLKQMMGRQCTKGAMQAACAASEMKFTAMFDCVAATYTTQEDFRRLAETMRRAQQQQVALEQLVGCKLDRSDLGLLEAAKSTWSEILASQQSIGRRLEAAESGLGDLRETTTAAAADAATASEERERLKGEVAAAAAESVMEDVVGRVQRLAVQQETSERSLAAANEALLDAAQELCVLKAEQQRLDVTKMKPLRAELDDSVAVAARLAGDVDGLRERVESSIERSVALAAVAEAKDQLLQNVQSLLLDERTAVKQQCSQLDRRIRRVVATAAQAATRREDFEEQLNIVMRFIDWFSERGASYEHNANVVEKHMQDLALRSGARRGGFGTLS